MRRFVVVVGLLGLLLFAAVPALAGGDSELLGSGVTPPENGGQEPAGPVDHTDVVEVASSSDGSALAATGIDSGVLLVVGLGFVTAGGAAVVSTRKRARV